MSSSRSSVGDGTSTRPTTAASSCDAEISFEESDGVGKPRMGLGSTANENIALRQNCRELALLWKTQKTLVDEEDYVLKLIDLYEKSVQLNYTRLTKRVKKIRSHLTEEEIIEMENDLRKKEFADKYRSLLHNQDDKTPTSVNRNDLNSNPQHSQSHSLGVIQEEAENNQIQTDRDHPPLHGSSDSSLKQNSEKQNLNQAGRSQSCQVSSNRTLSTSTKPRPETTPNMNDDSLAMDDIIPSLEGLLDQLHNIKPQQFYENQRKLKLYEIRLLEEELNEKKKNLFKAVDQIVNWDKKKEEKEEEEVEEEKPRVRKTSFMRSVLRNFSMELMAKTMQYGWADLGQCRYLRNRGGDDDQDGSGAHTLAKDTMKTKLDNHQPQESNPHGGAGKKQPEPGFDANGKMIRTADLLGLK